MKCPLCGNRSRIIDSRPSRLGTRRRHECPQGHRKTTYEVSAAFLFRLAQDVMSEPGFFNRSEWQMESVMEKFVERYQLKVAEPAKSSCKLKLIKAG